MENTLLIKGKNGLLVFVIAGRLGDSLTFSKVYPIAISSHVRKVFVFKNNFSFEIPKCKYVIVPKYFDKIKFNAIKKLITSIYTFTQVFLYSIKEKPDIINGIYTFPNGLYSLIISRILGVPNIVSIIGEEEELKKTNHFLPFLGRRFSTFIYKHSDTITTKGKKTTDFLVEKKINKKKIFVFNGGIDTNEFKPTNEQRKIDILFVGLFSELKGPDRVLEVIVNLKKNFPTICAYFLGDGPLFDGIKTKVSKLYLEENVFLKGHVQNLSHYYTKSKLILIPSRMEGLSTAMLEAMACGCVPIISDVGNMTEAALHNINSLVVEDYMDTDKFASYAKELLYNHQKLETLSKNAVNTVLGNYSMSKQSKIFDRIIDMLFTSSKKENEEFKISAN